MLKFVLTLILIGAISVSASAVQIQERKPDPQKPPDTAAQRQDLESGFITPADVNVRIGSDARTFVVMAAVNAAGFDYEPGGQPLSPARVELRKDLAKVDPQIKARLAEFYKSHRRANVDESVDATRYAMLSLLMTDPPAFSIDQSLERPLPEDLKSLTGFVPLVREFYLSGGIRELVPKYTRVADGYAALYRRPVGEMIYQVLDYFHTPPQTVINLRPFVENETDPKKKDQPQRRIARNRTRQVFIVPDPLGGTNTAAVRGDILNQKDDLLTRRVGDDYIAVIGPSRTPTLEPVRQALIRFVIDPLVERNLKFALESKDQYVKLVGAVPTAGREYAASVYLVVRESLAQASEARLKRIQAGPRGNYTEDDAVFDLAQAYLRGAVLSFHFYDALIGFERVGINIADFVEQMLAIVKWEKEATRAKEFEPVVARVAEKRAKAAKAGNETTGSPIGGTAGKILASDDLIRQRRFAEARPVLEEVLAIEPNNARALYGMAHVVTQTPTPIEQNSDADENDKIQAQHDRLKLAVKLLRQAISNASRESELWLVQWSHVYIGRIFDFQELRQDAIDEYEKAAALGPIPGGAHKEALEGKSKPFGQKQ
jgi:tetratricopeptide (TPR) repeat protein